jgi:hypothetical protein
MKLLLAGFFLITLIPFAGAAYLVAMGATRGGVFYGHIFLVYALLFWFLGVLVHSIAPVFLLNDFFHEPGRWRYALLLWIAPAVTAIWSLSTVFGH